MDFAYGFGKVLFDCLPASFVKLDADAIWAWRFVCGHFFDYSMEFFFAD